MQSLSQACFVPEGVRAGVGSHWRLWLSSEIFAIRSIFTIGAFPVLVTTLVDVANGILCFSSLEKHSRRTQVAYLAALIVAVVKAGVSFENDVLVGRLDESPSACT